MINTIPIQLMFQYIEAERKRLEELEKNKKVGGAK